MLCHIVFLRLTIVRQELSYGLAESYMNITRRISLQCEPGGRVRTFVNPKSLLRDISFLLLAVFWNALCPVLPGKTPHGVSQDLTF